MSNKNTPSSLVASATPDPADARGVFRQELTRNVSYRVLEQRIVFDGAAVDAAADVAAAEPVVVDDAAGAESQQANDTLIAALSERPVAQSSRTIVFIDSGVNDRDILAEQLPDDAEIVVLDSTRDGLLQIAEALEGRQDLEGIHILSHGTDGTLMLAGQSINEAALDHRAAYLETIGNALSADGDILLYGCRVAETGDGQSFLQRFADLTSADVAGSDDITGHAKYGGDWDLEAQTGAIETAALSATEWDGKLEPLSISATGNPSIVFPATVPVGGSTVWTNAGFVGSTAVDLVATVVSADFGVAVTAFTSGDDPSIALDTGGLGLGGFAAGSATIRWELFESGTGQTVAAIGAPSFTVSDIDGTGAANTIETIAPSLNGLQSYEVGTSTALSISTTGGLLTASGTDDDSVVAGGPLRPSASITFVWSERSSWDITYTAERSLDGRVFSHDGDGDFVFASSVTTSLLLLDLDNNNSTASGSSFSSSFTEGGAAIPIVDADVTITQHPALGSNLGGASLTLTNAQAGDVLSVATLPPGISALINTSVSGEITVTLTGDASVADYETALEAIRFENTSNDPNTTDRQIQVAVTNTTFGTSSLAAVSTISVLGVNQAPAGADNTISIDEDNGHSFAAPDFGFSDSDGDVLASVFITSLPDVSDGVLTLNGVPVLAGAEIPAAQISNLVFTPTSNLNGNGLGGFTFQVKDNGGTANSGEDTDQSSNSIQFNIASINDAPTADNESVTIDEDTPVTIDVLTGDGDVDGSINPASVGIADPDNPGTFVTTLTETGVGTWTVDTDPMSLTHGQIAFTPVLNYNGPVTPITYQVADNEGATTTATVNVAITAVNDTPVANPELLTTNEDTSLSGLVLANDIDVDGDMLTVSMAQIDLDGNGALDTLTLGALTPILTAAGDPIGQISIAGDGTFVFVPAIDYAGPVPPLTYTVNDSNGGTATAALTIVITPTPDARNDPFQILEDASATNVNPLSNDDTGAGTDGVADVTITSAPSPAQGTLTYQVGGTGALVTVADGALLSAAEAATLAFTPSADFSGVVTIPYTLTDLNANASAAQIAITVVATPDLVNDTLTTNEDTALALNPLSNDDTGTGAATVEITSLPPGTEGVVSYTNAMGATITLTAPGVTLTPAEAATLLFTPSGNFNGPVTNIGYTVVDTNGETDSATISVTVTAINDAPEGTDTTVSTDEDTPYTFSSGDFGFSDPSDADAFESVFINTVLAPGAGVLTLNGMPVVAGQEILIGDVPQLAYTPPANGNGVGLAAFTFSVKDDGNTVNGGEDTDQSPNTLTIDVQSVDDPATLNGGSGLTIAGPTVTEADLANGSNPTGTGETATGVFTVSANDGIGTLSIAGTDLSLTDLTIAGTTPVGPISTASGEITISDYDTATGVVSYSYELTGPVDHPASGSDDIALVLTDTDGSTATATVHISILDDTATANADTDGVTEDAVGPDATASGNVVTGAGGLDSNTTDGVADVLGADGPAAGGPVTGVAIGGGTPDSAHIGTPLAGTHGSLVLNSDGSYIYTPASDIELSGGETATETFTYQITDGDGDTATTTLTILVTGADDGVSLNGATGTGLTLTGPTVSEADLATGSNPSGTAETGTGSFTLSAPDGLATLSIGGATVSRANLEALATTPIAPITTPAGTLTLTGYDAATGTVSYSYELNAPINHQTAASDNIAIVVSDEDGSSSDGALVITITDDAPTAHNDSDRVLEDGIGADSVASGNVFTGVGGADSNTSDGAADSLGADGAPPTGPITAVVAGTGAPAGLGGIGTSVAGMFGTLTLSSDGSYSYAPDGGNSAVNALSTGDTLTDVFTYEVTDSDGTTATAILTITIDGSNDAPVADPETAVVDEDGSATIPVAVGDTDVDGTINLSSVAIEDPANPGTFVSELMVTGQGVWRADPTTGTIEFTPEPNYNGPVDPITYIIADNEGATATATVTVTLNAVPDPVDDIITTDEDTPVAINPLANDPADDDTATVTLPALVPAAQGHLTYIPTSGPFAGVATPVPAGVPISAAEAATLVLTPAPDYNGPVDPIDYIVTDSSGDQNTATITISVTEINDLPVANDDAYTASEDTPLVVGVAAGIVANNDTDADALANTPPDALSVAAVNGTPLVSGSAITLASGSNVTLTDNGAFTYDANGRFEHLDSGETATDSFSYTVSDGRGGFDTADVTITITGANDAPVIVDPAVAQPDPGNPVPATDPATVIPVQSIDDGEDFTTTPLILVSDYAQDPDVETPTFTATSPLPPGLTLNGDGTVTGIVDNSASQGGDDPVNTPGIYTVQVVVDDGNDTATVTLTFDVSNPAPVAQDDSQTLGEDAATVSGNVLTDAPSDHDTAPDDDPLIVSQANQSGTNVPLGTPFTVAGGGTLTLSSDGSYAFDPGTAYNHLDDGETATETIVYTVSDGEGGTDTATLTLTIVGANDAPQVIDPAHPANDPGDPAYTPNSPVGPADPNAIIPTQAVIDSVPITPLDASEYFVDVDGEPLTFALDPATTPAWLMIDPSTGLITGTPPHDASIGGPTGDGTYSITIQVRDPDGQQVTTIVDFQVSNVAPIAANDTGLTEADRAVTLFVLDNDQDPDGDTLQVSAAGADNGTVVRNPDGSLTYKPNPGFSGTDTITYTIDDGNGGTATATVTISVQAVHVPTPVSIQAPQTDAPTPPEADLGVNGIILDAVKQVDQGSWRSTSLTATGIVVSAVNSADPLNGLAASDSIGGTTSTTLSNTRAWEALERALGDHAKDYFVPEGLTGFVLKLDIATSQSLDAAHTQLVVESLVSNDTLILNFSNMIRNQITVGADYAIVMSDGSPLPSWLNKIGGNVLIGRPPVDADLLSLRVKVINPDGTFEIKEIEIELQSGEVKPDKLQQDGSLKDRGARPLPFEHQFADHRSLDPASHDALAAFLTDTSTKAA